MRICCGCLVFEHHQRHIVDKRRSRKLVEVGPKVRSGGEHLVAGWTGTRASRFVTASIQIVCASDVIWRFRDNIFLDITQLTRNLVAHEAKIKCIYISISLPLIEYREAKIIIIARRNK